MRAACCRCVRKGFVEARMLPRVGARNGEHGKNASQRKISRHVSSMRSRCCDRGRRVNYSAPNGRSRDLFFVVFWLENRHPSVLSRVSPSAAVVCLRNSLLHGAEARARASQARQRLDGARPPV